MCGNMAGGNSAAASKDQQETQDVKVKVGTVVKSIRCFSVWSGELAESG